MSHIQQPPYGAPYQSPQPGYGHLPPGSHFQQPPYTPQQHGYPPQAQFPSPTQGYHYAAPTPPPGGPYGHPSSQQNFGLHGTPQGPPQVAMPGAPSHGYELHVPVPPVPSGARNDAEALLSAMKGFGTNEKQLIRILSKPDPIQMRVLVQAFNTLPKRGSKDLEQWLISETSGDFKEGLTALARGPLHQDAYLLYTGMKGMGTKESYLDDVLCCRSNADIRAIKAVYQQTYRKDLVAAVKNDLSLKTETMFEMILAGNRAEESAPYDPMAIDRDVAQLYNTMRSGITTDQLTVCSIIMLRSDNQLRGINYAYQQKHGQPVSTAIEGKFTGHMKDALLLTINRAVDPAMSAAEQLEDTMKGLGTKDALLVQRIIRFHWNRTSMDQVKRAYRHRYHRDLISRVKGELSGDIEHLLVSCLE